MKFSARLVNFGENLVSVFDSRKRSLFYINKKSDDFYFSTLEASAA